MIATEYKRNDTDEYKNFIQIAVNWIVNEFKISCSYFHIYSIEHDVYNVRRLVWGLIAVLSIFIFCSVVFFACMKYLIFG